MAKEELTIELKNATSTQIKVTVDGVEKQGYLYPYGVAFRYDVATEKIHFPCEEELERLNIHVGNLSQATLTTLSLTTASTIKDLFDALVTGKYFEGK